MSTNHSPSSRPLDGDDKTTKEIVLELLKLVVLAVSTIVIIRHFLFKPFYVKGASMEPNFFDHEYLVIDELSYRLREPARGDVVVFRYPNDPKEFFLKRIIGLPGERIKIAEGTITIYNSAHPEGKELHESYLPTDLFTIGEETAVIGENEYYVMGDNRSNSFDSRRFGAVNKSAIVGRAWFRGWPFSRIEKFEAPLFNL
jgi:signal peptidase I